MSGSRSTTGCWTCRIRRKKCDDGKPSCHGCTFRQLTCHGYGPKPAWMDSAESQKAEVEKIKQAVNQNFRSRRAYRISKSTARSHPNSKASETQKGLASNSALTGLTDSLDENIARFANLKPTKIEGVPMTSSHLEARSHLPDITAQLPTGLSRQPDAKIKASGRSETKVYPFSFHPDAPLAENEHELSLILYYLNNVFPLQYYFYQPASLERGRGWVLGLLLRARSSYFTALAFSCVYQILFIHRGNISMQQKLLVDFDRYHSLALSELQAQLDILPTVSGYDHLRLGVDILACMMQLMSIEVFRETKEWDGFKDNWEVHLDAAGALLSVIGTDLRISSASSPSSSDGEGDTEQPRLLTETQSLLPLNEIAALDLFMTSYMWGDIFRCASTGHSSSSDLFSYVSYLEEDRVHLDRTMGCRNWAMIGIKKISSLETWRQTMRQSRTLNIEALSRQAAEIEAELHNGLESVFKDQSTLTTYEQECNLVTQLYALSALVYLTVVVSGCMAIDSQKKDFKQLLTDAHTAGNMLGTLWNGLEIMEEFWRLREDAEFMQTANKCAWAIAMDSLGAKILLI
ncbi:Pestheic acid cluster transcriptional regulator 3 [Hyphodiscus hymeniophilus]|uniref:Pestheic acid cluster transcriptional regulator 3 n=1 Tax=Hyphodiscus hymeniophilus TaxID=353542 RepID=A0A9P6SN00_9HELO|nr:Pestheic acid cluster transcriptional regulator 3 [Hyphodiscus hymeniophilus]